MPYVSADYSKNADAPLNYWVCTRTSGLPAYEAPPPTEVQSTPDFCGQCVSYVTKVCPTLPVNTGHWKKGQPVKNNKDIKEGTAIATFNAAGRYYGHAAIYVSQDLKGIRVYDQWISGIRPKSIGPRLITWTGHGISNNGDSFFVIEP